jgi:hypothetical protein
MLVYICIKIFEYFSLHLAVVLGNSNPLSPLLYSVTYHLVVNSESADAPGKNIASLRLKK